MSAIAGIDGFRGGWVAALCKLGTGTVRCVRVSGLDDLLGPSYGVQLAAIDIPIGLSDSGPRVCDVAA